MVAMAAIVLEIATKPTPAGNAGGRITARKNSGVQTISSERKSDTLKRERSPSRDYSESNARLDQLLVKGTYESNLIGQDLEPVDGETLNRMIDDPTRDIYDFSDLILRAAAGKDPSFRRLFDNADLRDEPRVDLAISAYDYAVNKNPDALTHILTRLAEHMGNYGSTDSDELLVLSYVNEWKLTKKTILAHPLRGDGTGGDALYSFWLKRRSFFPDDSDFPKDYEEFKDQVSGR